ncbi:glucose/arabinose dehydrogenase [Anseongella ginsenosidimutans]|uniref:Glucose/arabinose dehydrogenase n=1 Tax=Anseongella ginsenosidimutans TaxID=496056 RepID=A0A4R3KPG3_9SPHI|nr:PQQ-dependent sugar dehydrogenase [Anseongella ginsenosidimutans]QEC52648.1 sorbosone dehydrogenase [Anseongella ginsenosidimutans]TCS86572.1 glucose/arabinose dehydrogenase [Anseongella ginsenosidimutans]
MKARNYLPVALAAVLATAGCQPGSTDDQNAGLAADPDNGSIELPENFGALVVADSLGRARHLTVRENGDIYVAIENLDKGGGIAALRDTTGDGKADQISYFGDYSGTGIGIRDNYLYFAPDSALFRYPFKGDELLPEAAFETIAYGLTSRNQHAAKTFTFDDQGNVYINIGAPSNACQDPDRTPGTPGQDPCPILEYAGGIWRFSAGQTKQSQEDGHRYATGIRNAVALDWNSSVNTLYALQHGRDQLANFWPELYTNEESAELPAEEFFLVRDGSDFGWPYCYYDHIQNKKVLSPEYGGDGRQIARCDSAENPIMAFPGHWAPNDVLFYDGDMFPEQYKNGAFIAFHGSWNRAPLKQAGYLVAFVPFNGDQPSGDWEVFAEGFTGTDSLSSPGDAEYRPMGLAQGPDGSLYISDSQNGRIWRVIYEGKNEEN